MTGVMPKGFAGAALIAATLAASDLAYAPPPVTRHRPKAKPVTPAKVKARAKGKLQRAARKRSRK